MADYEYLHEQIAEPCDTLFHLAWQGGRYYFSAQYKNVEDTLWGLEAVREIGCRRFICTGLQADIIAEETLSASHRCLWFSQAGSLYIDKAKGNGYWHGMEWVWGRILSLDGRYEPTGRMLPELVASLKAGKDFYMQSDGEPNWDYFNVIDGVQASIALAERGKNGEIYNIASCKYKLLKDFAEYICGALKSHARGVYAENKKSLYSLQTDIRKITTDTGWKPDIKFYKLKRI